MNTLKTLSAIVARQAPEAGSGSETEVVKRKVAQHDLIGADGSVLPEDQGEETATGIRYTLLANGQSFDYQYGQSPDMDRMLACFGAKTLATNETSAARNNSKGEASPDEQIAAVRERFALLSTGTWVDRTREGIGAKVDPDALAEAICQVMVAEGKYTQEEVEASYKAKVRQKISDDAVWARKSRTLPAVASAYATIKGRATATVDDLMLA